VRRDDAALCGTSSFPEWLLLTGKHALQQLDGGAAASRHQVLVDPCATKAYENMPYGFLARWQRPAVSRILSLCHEGVVDCTNRDMYEFGVFVGKSMRALTLQLKQVPYRHFWGFDSFRGLPNEDSGVVRSQLSEETWQRGTFSAADALRSRSYEVLEQKIRGYVGETRVQFVRVFYNESLTATLARDRHMRRALYVEIDCDLYTSSLQALDWMLANKLIVEHTILGYDDWITGGAEGEQKAHAEVFAKYHVQLEPLEPEAYCLPSGSAYGASGRTFEVIGMGRGAAPTRPTKCPADWLTKDVPPPWRRVSPGR